MSDQSRDEEITPERSAQLRDAVRRGMAELFAKTEKSINTPLTVQEITSLPDAELDDRVWLRLTSLVDCSDPARLAAEDPDVSAYLATRAFEWEVGNGGLHQYFFNYPDPDHLTVVLHGYARLGLENVRDDIEDIISPLAKAEASWRESLRDGTIETFFDSYESSLLPEHDETIGVHDAERLDAVRAVPEKFAR